MDAPRKSASTVSFSASVKRGEKETLLIVAVPNGLVIVQLNPGVASIAAIVSGKGQIDAVTC
jgi:hypothetical protein